VKLSSTKTNQLNLRAQCPSTAPKGTPVPFQPSLDALFAPETVPDFACPQCKKRTVCTKTVRMLNYPQVLMCQLTRFVFDEWVPKKLEVEFEVPHGHDIPFEPFRSPNNGQLLADEQAFPEDAAEEGEPDLNME